MYTQRRLKRHRRVPAWKRRNTKLKSKRAQKDAMSMTDPATSPKTWRPHGSREHIDAMAGHDVVLAGTRNLAWYRLTDRFYGRNVQGATAIASQLQELKRPTQIAESFHLLNVIRKLVREFARQSPKEPMPSAIVKAA